MWCRAEASGVAGSSGQPEPAKEEGMRRLGFYFSVMMMVRLSPHYWITRKLRSACERRIERYFRVIGH
jgi:hypothetical protein